MSNQNLTALKTWLRTWVVPPGITEMRRKRWESSLTPEEAIVLSRNRRFQNAYRGRRCFVIGNGPSLAKHDLSPLAGDITIVMNWFNQHPIVNQWKPTFYCRAENAEAYDSPERIASFRDVTESLDCQAYFLPLSCKRIVDAHGVMPADLTFYMKLSAFQYPRSPIELCAPMAHAQDTSVMATMLAVALGCSPIILLGLDYDWLSYRGEARHFYNPSHAAVARCEGRLGDPSSHSYLQLIRWSLSSWGAHDALRDIASINGQRIYNATEGSFLDTYPTTTLSDALVGRFE